MKDYILTLSAFGDVKRMNYEELAKWAAELYQKGFKAGKASVTSKEAFIASLSSVLKSTYDIGELRAKAIIRQLAKILNSESNKEND